jgi:hypothetical protein
MIFKKITPTFFQARILIIASAGNRQHIVRGALAANVTPAAIGLTRISIAPQACLTQQPVAVGSVGFHPFSHH